MAIIPEELQGDFMEEWKFPMFQLRKRLHQGGISSEAIDRMDETWWARINANLADYEQRFGEPHPATLEREERLRLSSEGYLGQSAS
jgi:hypothetical protein